MDNKDSDVKNKQRLNFGPYWFQTRDFRIIIKK